MNISKFKYILLIILVVTKIFANSDTDEEMLSNMEKIKLPICGIPYTNCLLDCEEYQADGKRLDECDSKCEVQYRKCIDKELSD